MRNARARAVLIAWGTALLLVFAVGQPACAQAPAESTPPTGEGASPRIPLFIVESTPTGAVVTLSGPYEWVGSTPWRLTRDLQGLYQVQARRPGYETWNGEVVLGDGGVHELNIRLSRKTPAKTFLRSAFVPGWGQIYRGSSTKGVLFLLAEVASLGCVAWTDQIYQDRVDDFASARASFESATRQEDLEVRYDAVRRAADRADRAYDHRKIFLAAAVGVYGLNLLDALVFAPGGEAEPVSLSRRERGRGSDASEPEAAGGEWNIGLAPSGELQAAWTYRWK